QSAIDAAKAGAAIVHIHVRDPKTTRPSMDPALYKEVVDRIRGSGSDVLINLTTGPGARFVPGDEDPQKPGPGTTIKSPAERGRDGVGRNAGAHPPRVRAQTGQLQPGHGQREYGASRLRQHAASPRSDGAGDPRCRRH